MNTQKFLLSLALIVTLIWGTWLLISEVGELMNGQNRRTVTQIDTTYITRTDTITIKARPKVIYRYDTLLLTPPFTATLDTAIGKRIWKADYHFPEHSLEISSSGIDTSLILVQPLPECPSRTSDIGIGFLAGTALGFAISIAIGK